MKGNNPWATTEEKLTKPYKGKYLLAFYDEEDELVAVLNNAWDLARANGWPLTNRYYTKAASNLNKIITCNYLTHLFGKRCRVHLIEV